MTGWKRVRLASTMEHSDIRGLIATCHVYVAELPRSLRAGQLTESTRSFERLRGFSSPATRAPCQSIVRFFLPIWIALSPCAFVSGGGLAAMEDIRHLAERLGQMAQTIALVHPGLPRDCIKRVRATPVGRQLRCRVASNHVWLGGFAAASSVPDHVLWASLRTPKLHAKQPE